MPLTILAMVGGLLIVVMTPYDTFGWILFGFGTVITAFWVLVAAVFVKVFRREWNRF